MRALEIRNFLSVEIPMLEAKVMIDTIMGKIDFKIALAVNKNYIKFMNNLN